MFFIGKTDILLHRIALLLCVGLTFANVDYESMVMRFNQKKSAGRSAHAAVVTPLNNELLRLIGNPVSFFSLLPNPMKTITFALKKQNPIA